MQQTACIVFNPTSVDSYAYSLIVRRRVGPQTQLRLRRNTFTSGLGLDAMSLAWFELWFHLTLACSGGLAKRIRCLFRHMGSI